MYFQGGRAKLLLGICRGKQHEDKREAKKKADAQRGPARAMRNRG